MIRAINAATLTNVLIQAVSILTGILLARLLGVEGRGEFAVALLWPSLLAHLALFGGDIPLSRLGADQKVAPQALYRLALVFTGFFGTISMLIGFYSLPSLLPETKSHLIGVSQTLLLMIPVSMLNVFLFSIALGRGDYPRYNLARGIFSLVWLVALCFIWMFFGASVATVSQGFLFAAFVGCLCSSVIVMRDRASSNNAVLPKLRHLIRLSLPFAAASLVTITYVQLANVVASFLLDLKSIGIYTVSFAVSSLHLGITGAMGKVFFSHILRNQDQDIGNWFSRMFRYSLVLNGFIAVMLILILPPIVPIVFGSQFTGSATLLLVLVPAVTLLGLAQIADEAIKATGQATPSLWARLAGGACLVCTALTITPYWGMYGVALAVGVGAAIELFVLLHFVSHSFHIPFGAMLIPRKTDMQELAAKSRNFLLQARL